MCGLLCHQLVFEFVKCSLDVAMQSTSSAQHWCLTGPNPLSRPVTGMRSKMLEVIGVQAFCFVLNFSRNKNILYHES